MAGEWYLGPAGDLRALVCPERDVNVSEVRYGGVHQGLSGARTVDVTGVKFQVDFNFSYLTQADYLWLEALHLRHIPGPLYMINPLKKNLLTKESSMCRSAYARLNGIYSADYNNAWQWENSFPSGPPGVRSVKRIAVPASTVTLRFDDGYKTPVTVGTTYDFSAYMKSDSAKTVGFGIAWYDKNHAFLSQASSNKSVTTSWARYDYSATAPASAALAVPYWTSTTNVSFTSTAAQFEVGSSPTSWEFGGGAMCVVVDQMPATSPRFPMRNASLTLLEM